MLIRNTYFVIDHWNVHAWQYRCHFFVVLFFIVCFVYSVFIFGILSNANTKFLFILFLFSLICVWYWSQKYDIWCTITKTMCVFFWIFQYGIGILGCSAPLTQCSVYCAFLWYTSVFSFVFVQMIIILYVWLSQNNWIGVWFTIYDIN